MHFLAEEPREAVELLSTQEYQGLSLNSASGLSTEPRERWGVTRASSTLAGHLSLAGFEGTDFRLHSVLFKIKQLVGGP